MHTREVIAKTYLVDFNTAEQIKVEASDKKEGIVEFKDIMGLTQKIPAEQILKDSESVIDKMADAAAQKIIELNGNRPVNAVFVVGGGGISLPATTTSVVTPLTGEENR